jgi:hypothetical protein
LRASCGGPAGVPRQGWSTALKLEPEVSDIGENIRYLSSSGRFIGFSCEFVESVNLKN